jgi:hypothetical protein
LALNSISRWLSRRLSVVLEAGVATSTSSTSTSMPSASAPMMFSTAALSVAPAPTALRCGNHGEMAPLVVCRSVVTRVIAVLIRVVVEGSRIQLGHVVNTAVIISIVGKTCVGVRHVGMASVEAAAATSSVVHLARSGYSLNSSRSGVEEV